MVKDLRKDCRGEERLFKTFVFFAIFIAGATIVLTMMSTAFSWGEKGFFQYNTVKIQIGNTTYSMITADDGIQSGNLTGFYNVTVDDVKTYFTKDDGGNFYFTDENQAPSDELQLRPVDFTIMPSYANPTSPPGIIIFERWGWFSTEYVTITKDTIKEGQLSGYNASAVGFTIHSKYYELIVITNSTPELHEDRIDQDVYWVGISYDALAPENMASTSLWGMLGLILTARLPEVPPVIQFAIAIPFWAGFSFMVFTLISRMIPFISGG